MRFSLSPHAHALVTGLCLVTLLAPLPIALARKKEKERSNALQLDEQKRVVHALNRLSFGPRPGDVEHVKTMGLDKWIDLQLHPEKIEDHALESHLDPLRTLRMDSREIAENFPSAQMIKLIADGKASLPSNSTQRAIYQAQLERYYQRQENKQEAANGSSAPSTDNAAKQNMREEQETHRREERIYADGKLDQLRDLSPEQRLQAVLKMPPQDQITLGPSLHSPKGEEFLAGMTAQQQETMLALSNPQQLVGDELMQGKLLREIYSERQLLEVMTDFWFNHFNVFIGKGADRYMLTSYERDVIRPHALGKFEDLLMATAQSPAMLFYLDNWLSVGPESDFALGIPKRPMNAYGRRRFPPNRPAKRPQPKRSGLNENYGRELMELHTLGVNGGYSQRDVTEVARVFTGWTLKEPREGGSFTFDERKHEPGDKFVLGHRIKPAGEKEGREVLHLLARNPATAKFICTKLAVRFVSDTPPATLVDTMSQTFLKKDGEIREVLKTMLASPEFWSPEAYRAKVKTPLEFAVSSLRATGSEVTNALPLARQLQTMGMPLYGAQPPTGYSSKADAWVNSSALLGRMNFALALTGQKMRGIQLNPASSLNPDNAPADPQQSLLLLENALLGGDVSKQTHDTIAARLQDPKISQRKLDDPARPPDIGMISGLLLGSPEFQRK